MMNHPGKGPFALSVALTITMIMPFSLFHPSSGAADEPTSSEYRSAFPDSSSTASEHLAAALGVTDFTITARQYEEVDENTIATNNRDLANLEGDLGLSVTTGDYPDGFAGNVVNPATGEMWISWVGGALPSDMTEVIARAPGNIVVNVNDAEFDRNYLNDVIVTQGLQDREYFSIAQARPDGTGIAVGSVDDRGLRLIEAYAEEAPFSLHSFTAGELVDRDTHRNYDYAPLKGGAFIESHLPIPGAWSNPAAWTMCSTGYLVKRVTGSGTAYRMLTAGHCLYHPNGSVQFPGTWYRFGDTRGVPTAETDVVPLYPGHNSGYATWLGNDVDGAVLNIVSPQTWSSFIYRGGQNASSSSAQSPTGAVNIAGTGYVVRTNGANSGERWAVTTGVTPNGIHMGVSHPQPTYVTSAGGDSGGPVVFDDGSAGMKIAGMIQSGIDLPLPFSPCEPPLVVATAACGTITYYTRVHATIARLNNDHGTGWSIVY